MQPSGMASALTTLWGASLSNCWVTTTSLGSSSFTPRCFAAASSSLHSVRSFCRCRPHDAGAVGLK